MCVPTVAVCYSHVVDQTNKLLHGHAMNILQPKKEGETHAHDMDEPWGIMLNEMSVPEGQVQYGVTSMRSLE